MSDSDKYKQHSDGVREALLQLEVEKKAVLKAGMATVSSAGGDFFPLDFLVLGAIKRYVSTAEAFRLMIESWNMICARTLLRMHIDTALRFSAAWLVADPHAFASAVLGGERIDRMKDREGQRLTDARLVQIRASDHPWLPKVYSNLSGYVHFSGSHIFDSISTMDDETHTMHFQIAEMDTKFPDSSWSELVYCFLETSSIFREYLRGYAVTKDLAKKERPGAAR
jgi:hypothetical protein